jgi:hypothetical protein
LPGSAFRWDARHDPFGHRYGPKLAAGALAKPPRLTSGISGQQLDWRADPASGEPYAIGDAMVGASIVHQASWGDKNKFLGIVGVLSVCTITGYDGLYADMTQVTFSGRNATGYFHDFMYLSTQLGAMPEGAALDMTAPDASNMPDWSAAIRLSGLATIGLVMVADINQRQDLQRRHSQAHQPHPRREGL